MKKESKQDAPSSTHNGAAIPDQWLAYCQRSAELFNEAWRDAPDEVLYSLIEGVWNGRSTFTHAALSLTSDFRTRTALSESDHVTLICGVTFSLMLSVGNEFIRRTALAETKAGRLARKFAVQPNDFTEQDMKDLARSAQFKSRYNPDGLGDKGERRKRSSEENASIIFAACARLLSEETIPTANSKEGLQKLMSGWFNGIPRKADNMLIEELRRNTIRQENTVQVGKPEDEDGNPAPNTVADFPVQGGTELDDRNGWRLDVRLQKPVPDQILLAEMLAVDTLTPRERQVVEFFLDGKKEREIAAKLAVSQPRINQMKASARRKMQRAKKLRSSRPASEPES